jgi:23S rRNA pseudouridine955/2504/2580 synthase
MTGAKTVEVATGEAGLRLDRWFRRHFPDVSHARLEKLLRVGQIRVDGHRVKAGIRLEPGQAVRVPPLGENPAAPTSPRPAALRPVAASDARALEARILYRDEAVIALDKPAGLAVQGGTRTPRHLDAMLEALRFGNERPRLVHRLDKDTSGVLLLARSAASAAHLTRAFRSKAAHKTYWAVVVGVPGAEQGRIDLPLVKRPGSQGKRVFADREGLRAVTDYRVVERAGPRAAWLELEPITGRTHQLRLHCAVVGTPILGDGKYGGRAAFLPGSAPGRGLHLHARAIAIPHPSGGILEVEAPLPGHMLATWDFFGFTLIPAALPVLIR